MHFEEKVEVLREKNVKCQEKCQNTMLRKTSNYIEYKVDLLRLQPARVTASTKCGAGR